MILEWLIKRREVTVEDDAANEVASVELSVSSDAGKEELVLTESNAWLHGSAALSALPAKDAALTLTLYDKGSATLSTFSGTLAADGTVTLAAADSGKIVCDKSGCTTVDEVDVEVLSAEVFASGKGFALTVDLAGADTYEVAYATIGVTGGEKAEVDWDAVGSIWEAESTLDHAGVIVVKATSHDAGGKTLENVKAELAEPWIDDGEGVNALSAGAGTSVAVSRNRAFGAGKYAIELDGINAGWISSVVSDGWTATSYPTHATLEVGGDSTTVPANSYQRSTTLLKIGDEVEATVLSIDRDEGRMGITSGKLQLTGVSVSDLSSPLCAEGTCVVLVAGEKGYELSVTTYGVHPAKLPQKQDLAVVIYDEAGGKLASMTTTVEFEAAVTAVFAAVLDVDGDPNGDDASGSVSLLGAADKQGRQATLSKASFHASFSRDTTGDLSLGGYGADESATADTSASALLGDAVECGGEGCDGDWAPPVVASYRRIGAYIVAVRRVASPIKLKGEY